MKTALVTGSSRGIGKAIALRLAKDGYRIIVHGASDSEKLRWTVEEIKEMAGEAKAVIADLCNPKENDALYDAAKNCDILVLNASLQYRTPWIEIPSEEITAQLNCNFVSSLKIIQAAVPYLKEQKWGRIITIGSVQETRPHPDMLIYSSSKAAQTAMVKSLALQLAKDGITVNNVAPGVIYTDRNVEALSDPEYAKIVSDSIPAGFYGKPEDCAGIVSLLCSEESRYITGQNIFVDGGKGIQ